MRLELRGITKRFGSLTANDHIDLVVEPGEIHALLGENGAGKSTLMNVLYGIYDADEGDILLDGVPQKFRSAGDAVAAGIGMVHQHFMLVPVFTVAESVALGYEPTNKLGIISSKAAKAKVQEVSERFGFNLDPDAYIEDLLYQFSDDEPEYLGMVMAGNIPFVLMKGKDEEGEYLYAETMTNGHAIMFDCCVLDGDGETLYPITQKYIDQIKSILETFQPVS